MKVQPSSMKTGHMQIGRRLAITAKAVRAFTEGRLSSVNASLSTVIISRILTSSPGLSQRQIAERMDITAPTVLRHLERMEADALITRERDPKDKRLQRVTLTTTGAVTYRRLEGVATAAHNETVAVFSASELATFEALLDRLALHATQLQSIEVST